MIYTNLLALCFMYVLVVTEMKDRKGFKIALILLFLANAAIIFVRLRYGY